MVWHYALLYGFHTLPNMLINLSERQVALLNNATIGPNIS